MHDPTQYPTPLHHLAAEIEDVSANANALHNAMEATLPAHSRVQEAHKKLMDSIRKVKSTVTGHMEALEASKPNQPEGEPAAEPVGTGSTAA